MSHRSANKSKAAKATKMKPEDENRCVEDLRKRMEQVTPLEDEPNFATDTDTLVRFLRARDWRVDDSEKLLKATTEWRRDYKPLSVDCKWCHDRPGFHCMRQVGFDKQNRPVIYSCFAQQVTRKNLVDDTVAHCTCLMENAVKTMKPGVSKIVWVLDCTGMTMACCNPKLGYGCGQIFANFYPERLGLVICINHSPVFQGVWKAIKVFLDPKTASKVQLSRSKEKINELFNDTFPAELCKWIKEEIELNKQKHMPKSQKQFYECPADPRAHDPRGCLSYVMNYIEPYIAMCRSPEKDTRCFHRPHPNIIDRLKGDIKVYTEEPPCQDELPYDMANMHVSNSTSCFDDDDDGACAEIEIPDEYQIDETMVTRM